MTGVLLLAAAAGCVCKTECGTMAEKQTDWKKINQQAFEKSLVPVALPQRDKIPFGNRKAVQFICPPVFEAPRADGVKRYRFELKDDAGKMLASFEAADSREPLTPVWGKVPVEFVNLTISPVGKDGKTGDALFTRRFYRCAWFKGPYPLNNHDYRGGAEKCFRYIYTLPHVQAWLTGGTVDDKAYRKYCYPSKLLPALVRALRHHAELDGSPAVRDQVTKISTRMADWLIDNSCAPGTPLEYLPPTYWEHTSYKIAKQYVGQIMMIYPMSAGHVYLDAFKFTRDKKYLQAACRLADSMKRLQLPNGSWMLKVRISDGTPVVPNVVVFDRTMHEFLTELAKLSGNREYLKMRDRAMERIWKHNLPLWDWDGQFEDIMPKPQYENLTKDGALFVAEELFKKGDVQTALKLVDWSEDQFVVWSDPAPTHRYAATWRLPAALEQYNCYMPIDASCAQFVFAFCRAYRVTGNELYLEKAKAIADNILRNQRPDGFIPTFFQDSEHLTWLNCMTFSAESLLYLDETLKGEKKL